MVARERVTLGLDVQRLHFFDPSIGGALLSDTDARVEVPAL
jgi:hypothetical protein